MGANAALLGAYEAIDEKKSATSEKKSLMAERFQKRRTRDAPTQEHRRFRPQKSCMLWKGTWKGHIQEDLGF